MIDHVIQKVKRFLEKVLEVKEVGEHVRITGVISSDGGWIAQAEVVERSRTLPGHHVFDTNYYVVKLGADQEIYAYEQLKSKEEMEGV